MLKHTKVYYLKILSFSYFFSGLTDRMERCKNQDKVNAFGRLIFLTCAGYKIKDQRKNY